MDTPEDDDVAIGIEARWKSFNLDSVVPGSLQRGRLSTVQTVNPDTPGQPRKLPFAGFTVRQGPRPNVETTNGSFVDHRLVLIEVRGVKADVVAALKPIRAAFIRKTFSVPNVVGMMGSQEVPEQAGMREDEHTRAGETLWIDTVAFVVICHRQYE